MVLLCETPAVRGCRDCAAARTHRAVPTWWDSLLGLLSGTESLVMLFGAYCLCYTRLEAVGVEVAQGTCSQRVWCCGAWGAVLVAGEKLRRGLGDKPGEMCSVAYFGFRQLPFAEQRCQARQESASVGLSIILFAWEWLGLN